MDEQMMGASPEQPSKNSEKKPKKKWLWLIPAVLAVPVLVGCLFVAFQINGKTLSNEVSVSIPQGSATVTVADCLAEEDIIDSPLLFRVYCRIKGYDGRFQYGDFVFSGKVGYHTICEKLVNEGAQAKTVRVTIPEGTGINDYVKNVNGALVTVPGIATLLEKAGVCSKEDFLSAVTTVKPEGRLLDGANNQNTYYTLEGYLFPDTYDFYAQKSSAENAVSAVQKMLSHMQSMITDEMIETAKSRGYTMHEVLTLASVVQMESAGQEKEMPNVAAVFYNRLKSTLFASLGSSPTCYYGNSFAQDDGRYNTYNIQGLPPGPLCSPGLTAVKAVLQPTENSPYFYFVTDKDGKFYYHVTYAEQEQTVSRLKESGNWIYEYFD